MPYRVELAPAAQRDLQRLPREIQARLAAAIQALSDEPRPPGVRKLRGEELSWRIRVGAYRVIYDVHDSHDLVVVFRISRRNEATYRR